MTPEQLITFNITLLVSIISPGPALLVAIQTTLSSGRAAGIAIGCGLGLMASSWTLMALLGLETMFRLFPWAYTGVRALGALYLIFIAWRTWHNARDQISSVPTRGQHLFRQGILINTLNPKSVLFAGAILAVIFPPGMTLGDNAIVVANHLIIELLFYATLAHGLSISVVRTGYLRAKVYLGHL